MKLGAWMGAVLAVGLWLGASAGCGGKGPGSGDESTGSTSSALSTAQCEYFETNGKTTICHATGSAKNPYVLIKVSESACVNAHANHPGDFIDVDGGDCNNAACLPDTAPCDPTLPCCGNLNCTDGTCQCPAGQTFCDVTCVDESSDTSNCGGCGTVCPTGWSCQSGTCISPCYALDQCHVAGTYDPATGTCSNPSAPDGTGCYDGNPCTLTDTCQSGTCVGSNPRSCAPTDSCHNAGTCSPGTGECSNPAAADGTACGSGEFCSSGSCVSGCEIGGALYSSGASDVTDGCLSCQPSTNSTDWSRTSCPSGAGCLAFGAGQHECVSGTGCVIDGLFIEPSATNPNDACQYCDASNPNVWSNRADGSSCNAGICQGGACGVSCVIGGTWYSGGQTNPSNACEYCNPSLATEWSYNNSSAPCPAGQLCAAGSCQPTCSIGGTPYAFGSLYPGNPCALCYYAGSGVDWTAYGGACIHTGGIATAMCINETCTNTSCAGLPDGLYCGSKLPGGDPNTDYQCTGGSVDISRSQTCRDGCEVAQAPGGVDSCY